MKSDQHSPGAFVEDTPTAILVRQVLGAVAQFDKVMTVAKLRLARERKRRATGKCEGRKSHLEERPEAVKLARHLIKQGLGYRAVSASWKPPGTSTSVGAPSTTEVCGQCWRSPRSSLTPLARRWRRE